MEARDLRIGIIVNKVAGFSLSRDRYGDDKREMWNDKTIIIDKNNFAWAIDNINFIEGISLTEDWLVKLNVSQPIYFGNDFYQVFESVDDDLNSIYIFSRNNENLKEVEYVHEIQNGWHFLTGFELEVK